MCVQLGFPSLPASKPEATDPAFQDENNEEAQRVLRDLHRLLLETHVVEGKLVCGNCGHEYRIKEGIANFLLPSHLGTYFFSCFGGLGLDWARAWANGYGVV